MVFNNEGHKSQRVRADRPYPAFPEVLGRAMKAQKDDTFDELHIKDYVIAGATRGQTVLDDMGSLDPFQTSMFQRGLDVVGDNAEDIPRDLALSVGFSTMVGLEVAHSLEETDDAVRLLQSKVMASSVSVQRNIC